MRTTLNRVPQTLSDFLNSEAQKRGVHKMTIYKEIEEAMKGIPNIVEGLKQRKNDKPPFAF